MRSVAPAAALATVLVTAGGTAVAVSAVPLTRDADFVVTAPRDGDTVGRDFLLSWSAVAGRSGYAVVVDADVPAPGRAVASSAHVLTVTGTSLRLTLGRARTGSPSARGYHTVTVLALDGAGRRAGSAAAVVHVRNPA